MIFLHHLPKAGVGIGVQVTEGGFIQDGDKGFEAVSPRHPLVIFAAIVLIGAIDFGAWDKVDQPLEYVFVADMHAKCDLRLFTVSPKVAVGY